MDDLRDVTVSVPADRLADFYEHFAVWLRGATVRSPQATAGSSADTAPWDPTTDAAVALAAWKAFPPRARQIFGTLIDHPDERYTGEQLAEIHDIPNGMYGVAGALAWPGRRLRRLGRPLPFQTAINTNGGSYYWMRPAIARLFGAARKEYEATA